MIKSVILTHLFYSLSECGTKYLIETVNSLHPSQGYHETKDYNGALINGNAGSGIQNTAGGQAVAGLNLASQNNGAAQGTAIGVGNGHSNGNSNANVGGFGMAGMPLFGAGVLGSGNVNTGGPADGNGLGVVNGNVQGNAQMSGIGIGTGTGGNLGNTFGNILGTAIGGRR